MRKTDEKKESELEEELEEIPEDDSEETEEIDNRFVEFLQSPTETITPSLGQVAVAPELRATDLEQDIAEIPGIETSKKDNEEFKYRFSANQEEAKYISSGQEIEKATTPSRVDITTFGREQNILPREVGFSASPSSQIGESSDIEKYISPDRFDINKAGKEDSFKKKEVKYEPTKEY